MQARLMDMPDPEWIEVLRAEVEKPGRTITSVAGEIGIKRSALSMLLSGKYPAKLDKVSAKYAATVLQLYRDQVFCQHQRQGISQEDCRALASTPMSTSNPDKLAQWSACRRCPLNPVNPPETTDARRTHV
ncbi:MAG: helix-turn-helix domain-containing protein [Pseudodonghicola sp.]